MRILRVRLDLQGRLTPVSALGVVSIEKAMYQPCVPIRFVLSCLFFPFPPLLGSCGRRVDGYVDIPFPLSLSGITLPTNGDRI